MLNSPAQWLHFLDNIGCQFVLFNVCDFFFFEQRPDYQRIPAIEDLIHIENQLLVMHQLRHVAVNQRLQKGFDTVERKKDYAQHAADDDKNQHTDKK